jgi:hypothetical protein
MLGNPPFELRAASASGKCVTPGINLWVQCPERLPALPAGESGVPRGLQIDLESCMHLLDLMAV